MNGDFSEVLPGSRVGWLIVIVAAELMIILMISSYIAAWRERRLMGIEMYSVLALGSVSAMTGYLYLGDPWAAALVCGAGSSFACLAYLLVGRPSFLSMSLLSGFLVSLLGGLTSSLMVWVVGSEKNVLQLALLGFLHGGVGLLSALAGAAFGYALVHFHRRIVQSG